MVSAVQPPRSTRGLADFYRVSERTVKNYREDGAPLHSVGEMAAWVQGKRVSAGLRSRLAELGYGSEAPKLREPDKDWEEYTARVGSDPTADPKASLAAITKARDFASLKFERAAAVGDREGMKFHADLLVKFEGARHAALVLEKKLGLDHGDTLSRPEVERIVFALAFWTLRATDQHLNALTSQLEKICPGLPKEQARRVLEGELLSDRFLIPFAHAAGQKSGVALPVWAVDKMRKACGDFLAKGEQAFTEELTKA